MWGNLFATSLVAPNVTVRTASQHTRARIAGVVAAAVALAVGELVSAFGEPGQSLVGGVGNEIVDRAAGGLVRFAIDVFGTADNSLSRGNNLNRSRWYSSSTVMLNGEIYIQGGSGGGDRPEIRDLTGGFRLLTGANTSGFSSNYPRN